MCVCAVLRGEAGRGDGDEGGTVGEGVEPWKGRVEVRGFETPKTVCVCEKDGGVICACFLYSLKNKQT